MKTLLFLLSALLTTSSSHAQDKHVSNDEMEPPSAAALLPLDYKEEDYAKALAEQLVSETSIIPASLEVEWGWGWLLFGETYYSVKVKASTAAEFSGHIKAELVDARDSRGELKGFHCQLKVNRNSFSLRNSAGQQIIFLGFPFPIASHGGFAGVTIKLTNKYYYQ